MLSGVAFHTCNPLSLTEKDEKYAIATTIEPLATVLKARGRILRQIERQGLVALYDVRAPGDRLYGYEVIRIKIKPPAEAFGRLYPEREAYPADEDWGTRAWSYPRNGLEAAKEHFEALVKEQSKKKVRHG
jgi:hypothetical protein